MIEIICRSRAMKGTRLVVPVCGTVARNNYQMDGMSWDGFRLIRFGLRQNVISEAKREEFRGWANLVRQACFDRSHNAWQPQSIYERPVKSLDNLGAQTLKGH